MRAMPRARRHPRISVTGAPAGSKSRRPPDPAGTRGIARVARSYGPRAIPWPMPCTQAFSREVRPGAFIRSGACEMAGLRRIARHFSAKFDGAFTTMRAA